MLRIFDENMNIIAKNHSYNNKGHIALVISDYKTQYSVNIDMRLAKALAKYLHEVTDGTVDTFDHQFDLSNGKELD